MDRESGSWSLAGENIRVSSTPMALSILRVRRDDTGIARQLGDAFQLDWPTRPNTVVDESPRVAWWAPGEWAILQRADAIRSTIVAACAGRPSHLSDISAGHLLWRVSGSAGHTLIARGCSLDTHPAAFPHGACARTLFAQLPVLLLRSAPADAFEIVAEAGYEGYLQAWFADAVQEPVPPPP